MPPSKIKNSKLDWILHLLAAFLMPSILLFNLYNSNKITNHIEFTHVLLFAGVFGAIGILFFFIFKFFTKRLQSALIVSVLGWLSFWFFETLFTFARGYSTHLRRYVLMSVLAFILIIIAYALRRYRPKYTDFKLVFIVLSIFLIGFWGFNFVPGVMHEIAIHQGRAEREFNPQDLFKTNFNVDADIDRPDIYWFHMDGMMNLEDFEDFSGENIDWLREELAERGFLIYENASFAAGNTALAMPMLTSPYFYDNFWSELIAENPYYLVRDRQEHMSRTLNTKGISYDVDIRNNWELLTALNLAGYGRNVGLRTNPRYSYLTFPEEDFFYNSIPPFWARFHELPRLLNMSTPLNFNLESTTQLRDDDSTEYEAMLTWNVNHQAHAMEWPHFAPQLTGTEVFNNLHYFYPLALNNAALTTLDEVDKILERNPNAVIILQSDHAFHLYLVQMVLVEQGYAPDDIRRFSFSAFSAVRIPEAYGGLDEPIHPLNITRVLVNRFVGADNYKLLD